MRDIWAVTPNLGLRPAESDTENGSGMVGAPMHPYQYIFAKHFSGDLHGNAHTSSSLQYTQLSNNAVLDLLRGSDKATVYWAAADNTIENKPEGVNGFWLSSVRTGQNCSLQILFASDSNTYSGLWTREWTGEVDGDENRPVWSKWCSRLTEIDTGLKPIKLVNLDETPAAWALPFEPNVSTVGKTMRLYGDNNTIGLPWPNTWSGTFVYTSPAGYGMCMIFRSGGSSLASELAFRFWNQAKLEWSPWRLVGKDFGTKEIPYENGYFNNNLHANNLWLQGKESVVGSSSSILLASGYQTPGEGKYVILDTDGAFRPATGIGTPATSIGSSSHRWDRVYGTNGDFSGTVAVAMPTAETHAANKKYIDTELSHLKSAAMMKSDYDKTNNGKVDKAELADESTKLSIARSVRTNLASTGTASFDGTANIVPGVTGVLSTTNGGTGNTTGKATDSAKLNGQEASHYATASAVSTLQSLLNNKANTADVLTKTNSTTYTPTSSYHPATKAYVDNAMSAKGNGDMMKSVYDTNNDGIVDMAATLATARTVLTNLANTTAASFNGSANITPGVTGILPIANGGSGNTSGKAVDSSKLNGQEAGYYATAAALALKANTADVIPKANTTSYTPTASYHPATKKYVDDAIASASNTVNLSAINQNIIPESNQAYDIGSTSSAWNSIYAKELGSLSRPIAAASFNSLNCLGISNLNQISVLQQSYFESEVRFGGPLTPFGENVNIGLANRPFKNGYFNNLYVNGKLVTADSLSTHTTSVTPATGAKLHLQLEDGSTLTATVIKVTETQC